MKYPRIRGPLGCEHSTVEITWQEGEPAQIFCGDNWCTGKCNLPALIIPLPDVGSNLRDRFVKASGSQVACGAVMQSKRVEWRGECVIIPKEHHKRFLEAWYP